MKTYYKICKGTKHTEEDVFEEGCVPETGRCSEFGLDFTGASPEEAINKLKEYFEVENDSLQLDACEDWGRIDVEIMEKENGDKPTLGELALWKTGRLRLWLADYSFTMLKVTEEIVKLTN